MNRSSKQGVLAGMDRACKITAFRSVLDTDEKIMRAMMAFLEPEKPWKGRTAEQEAEFEEQLASRATCPKDGAAAVWGEAEDGA